MDNAAHRGPSRTGGLGETPSTGAILGTVLEAHSETYTHTVRTQRGGVLRGVPRKRVTPSDVCVLPVGTQVLVRFDIGMPYIDGVFVMPAAAALEPGVPLMPGSQPEDGLDFTGSAPGANGSYRGGAEPADVLPGDEILANSSGARAGVLSGGMAILLAGLAGIRAHRLNDLLEIFGRNMRVTTDMGYSEVRNRNGKMNYSFRGATDQLNEAGADEEKWTIRFDLGAEGDLLNFELCTPMGQTLFRVHVDAGGRCEIFGLDGVIFRSGDSSGSGEAEPVVNEHPGSVRDAIGGGAHREVRGDVSDSAGGNRSEITDGNSTRSVGADSSTQVARDVGLAAGRNVAVVVAGDRTGGTAARVEVRGGDYVEEVGSPDYPAPKRRIQTQRGNIELESLLGGNIVLNTRTGEARVKARKIVLETTGPDSVILGGSTLRAHVAKYEQLEQLVTAMFQRFDTHIHTHPNGPTGAPVVPMATLRSMLLRVKSTIVGLGN